VKYAKITFDRALIIESQFEVINAYNRGGLKYPTLDIVNIVAHNFIVIKKLVLELENNFLNGNNQKQIALQITINILSAKDISIHTCGNHSSVDVIYIIRASTYTLLNNYCKEKCDAFS